MAKAGYLGPYRLLRVLGRGGMGEVWEVFHRERPGERLALKTLGAGRHSSSVLRGLLDEAKIAAHLSHPNIIRVVDAGIADQRCYFVMELLEGHTLAQLRRPGERLDMGATAQLGLEALAALHHAHEQGVVHRDLKPSNLFLTQSGQLKLIDFGVARAELSEHTQTRTGAFRGTPAYASPEQVRGEPQDGRSDVFSLGLILRELLTGEREFRGDSAAVLHALLSRPLQPVRELNPAVSPALDGVLGRACQRDAAQRWGSAAEMASALAEAVPASQRWTSEQLRTWVCSTPTQPEVGTSSTTSVHLEELAPAPAILRAPPEAPPAKKGAPAAALALALVAVAALALVSAKALRHASVTPSASKALESSSRPAAVWDAGVSSNAKNLEAPSQPLPARAPAFTPAGNEREAGAVHPEASTKPVPRPVHRGGKSKSVERPEEGAFLTVDARPVWARVFVDGKDLGLTPLVRVPLHPGPRALRAVNAQGEVTLREVTLQRGREERVMLTW